MSNRIFHRPPDDESPAERELRESIASVLVAIRALIDQQIRWCPANAIEGPCSIVIVRPRWPWRATSLADAPGVFEAYDRIPDSGGYQRPFADAIAASINGFAIGDGTRETMFWAFVESTEPDAIRTHSTDPSTN